MMLVSNNYKQTSWWESFALYTIFFFSISTTTRTSTTNALMISPPTISHHYHAQNIQLRSRRNTVSTSSSKLQFSSCKEFALQNNSRKNSVMVIEQPHHTSGSNGRGFVTCLQGSFLPWFDVKEEKESLSSSSSFSKEGDKLSSSSFRQLDWVAYGISWVYLAHFASLYVQLPGLFGPTGLWPITANHYNVVSDFMFDRSQNLWLLDLFFRDNIEFGVEFFAGLGIVISMSQIVFGRSTVRKSVQYRGFGGIVTFGLQWILWHDLVMIGGRFTSYQMDLLLLDAAPIVVLSCIAQCLFEMKLLSLSSSLNQATLFGYRWLLSRLYIGAGAVKLLSCDLSWRDLSAIHYHFQSQPLPNPVGAWAYLHLPDYITHPLTLLVLIMEMSAPYLFLAPSNFLRKIAFTVNILLMVGIATFGNFGPLQILLIIIGITLLDDADLPPLNVAPGGGWGSNNDGNNTKKSAVPTKENDQQEQNQLMFRDDDINVSVQRTIGAEDSDIASFAVSLTTCALTVASSWWVIQDVGSTCNEKNLSVTPLVYTLLATSIIVAAILPFFEDKKEHKQKERNLITAIVSLFLLAGTIAPLFRGLGIRLPSFWATIFDNFNLGAVPYGLFAVMTGTDGCGRPVATIEGCSSLNNNDCPWIPIPLLFQINDSSSPTLPLIFPHFPRLDWTLWFVPLGETGSWIDQLLRGIINEDEAILNLLDTSKFHQLFPSGHLPEFVRINPSQTFTLTGGSSGWLPTPTMTDTDDSVIMMMALSSSTTTSSSATTISSSWPSFPVLRKGSEVLGRPEYFVWCCMLVAEVGRRLTDETQESETGTKS